MRISVPFVYSPAINGSLHLQVVSSNKLSHAREFGFFIVEKRTLSISEQRLSAFLFYDDPFQIARSRALRSERARLLGQSTRIDENRTDRRTKAEGNERGRPDGRKNIRRGAANMANEAERRMEVQAWSRVLPGGANRRIIIL